MGRPKLTAFCLDWHIDRSPAFRDLLLRPLEPFCDIELVAWDGSTVPDVGLEPSSPTIFCQLPPPPSLLNDERRRLVWIPMWDQARGYDKSWWAAIPKSLRVVSFSTQIQLRTNAAGLTSLPLRYFKDPGSFSPVSWSRGCILFYWNRTGMIGPAFLRKLCKALDARELIFLGCTDPRIDDRARFSLPSHLGKTVVTTLSLTSQEDYLEATRPANVFVAPRAAEGVGLSFLEAMARGSAVLAYNAPTMSEYIEDGINGALFSNKPVTEPSRAVNKLKRMLGRDRHTYNYQLTDRQDWTHINAFDLQALGLRARLDHEAGYARWQKSIPDYFDFISDW
jgi:hypothetical protein